MTGRITDTGYFQNGPNNYMLTFLRSLFGLYARNDTQGPDGSRSCRAGSPSILPFCGGKLRICNAPNVPRGQSAEACPQECPVGTEPTRATGCFPAGRRRSRSTYAFAERGPCVVVVGVCVIGSLNHKNLEAFRRDEKRYRQITRMKPNGSARRAKQCAY